MNITSPSSSLEQTNFVLEDWGTNPERFSSISNSAFEYCSVAMEANGSGYGCRLSIADHQLGKNEQTKLR
ncbi:hypothetical protein Tco_0990839 [Tanacetum coccineum]|uniref:Uncharacterized protein n=1 Tax=Tanacetum coccineum TaxID=301880 RepID=A0ABQ5EYQ4_9ASTR